VSRSTARVVAGVLVVPALLWGVALAVIVTADLPPLGGVVAGLPMASVALMSLSGAIVAAIVARRGREHRGDAPPRPRAAATLSGAALGASAVIALTLGGGVTGGPVVAEPAVVDQTRGSLTEAEESETGQRIVIGDHSEHARPTP